MKFQEQVQHVTKLSCTKNMIAGPVPFSNWREHPEGNHWLIYGSGCYAQDWPSRTH